MNHELELYWQVFFWKMIEWLEVKEFPLTMDGNLSTFFLRIIIIKSQAMLLLMLVLAMKSFEPSLFPSCKMLFVLRTKYVWKTSHWNLHSSQGCTLPLSPSVLFLQTCFQGLKYRGVNLGLPGDMEFLQLKNYIFAMWS